MDGDGLVSIEDLFQHVSTAMSTETHVNPQRWYLGLDGKCVVASNPRIRLSKLPQDVLDHLKNPSFKVRMLAIPKLQGLLSDLSLPMRHVPFYTLQRLQDDDSRSVPAATATLLLTADGTCARISPWTRAAYRDQSLQRRHLCRLRCPLLDAEGMREVLSDPQIDNFAVTDCLDLPSYQWRQHIANFFFTRTQDELLRLYIAGHGVKDPSGAFNFAAADTHVEQLLATRISVSFINEASSAGRRRPVVMIFDTCFS